MRVSTYTSAYGPNGDQHLYRVAQTHSPATLQTQTFGERVEAATALYRVAAILADECDASAAKLSQRHHHNAAVHAASQVRLAVQRCAVCTHDLGAAYTNPDSITTMGAFADVELHYEEALIYAQLVNLYATKG